MPNSSLAHIQNMRFGASFHVQSRSRLRLVLLNCVPGLRADGGGGGKKRSIDSGGSLVASTGAQGASSLYRCRTDDGLSHIVSYIQQCPGYRIAGYGTLSSSAAQQFRIEASTGKASFQYISDGTVLTIYNIPQKTYAQVAARGTLQGNMSLLAGLMGFQARIFDFFAALDQASEGTGSVQITEKGTGAVGGRECDRFIVTTMVEKWDVSLEKPAPHLPCKLVSGDVDDPSATLQVNEFTWEKAPNFTPDTFVFSPPPGTKKTDVGGALASPL